MKKPLSIFPVLLLSFWLFSPLGSAEDKPLPVVYNMSLVYIFEGSQTEYIFVVGNSGFKSIQSLKKFLSNLPVGSILEFDPTCKRLGNEPLLSSQEEMEDFKKFCEDHNIDFRVRPSG